VERRDWDLETRIQRLTAHLSEVRGEVHRTREADWPETLGGILQAKGVRRLAHGSGQADLSRLTPELAARSIEPVAYEEGIEAWKDHLFSGIDAGFTGCRGAIAETGSLILWPDAAEPRLLSLVPPLHCLVLRADQIFSTFAEAVETQGWASTMPTNPLLVSGPSKSADIAQVLAYGVHGPRTLVVMLVV
jgi:L-lactate dehydrogenase complex protein LldG